MKKLYHRMRATFFRAWRSLTGAIKTHKKQTLAVIIVAIILLTPIQFGIKDGGTTTYFSLIYQITIHHAHVDFDEPSDVLYVLEGTTVRILLIPIYDHTYLVTYKDGEPVDVDMPKTDLPGIYRGALDDLSTILASR